MDPRVSPPTGSVPLTSSAAAAGVVGTVRPSGTVTFMFTDIAGSTRLWERDRSGMQVALGRHDEIIRDAVSGHGGLVFSTSGDGFAIAFSRADRAIDAALTVQRALAEEPWPQAAALSVRVGVHTGEAQEREGNYFGPPLNLGARIMAAANGGQIVISAVTAGMLGVRDDIELIDLGPHRLQGIAEPVRLLGVATLEVAWTDRPLTTMERSIGTLTRPLNEFVGRDAEMHDIVGALRDHPLLTLVGFGGVGKSRLASETAWSIKDEYSDGVWMVELANVSHGAEVLAAVQSVLSIGSVGQSPIDSITDWLRGRHLLLILDNCEHVTDAVAELSAAVIARCPTVHVLATSREPLHIAPERVHPIRPLVAASGGVELFCARAAAADTSFHPDAADMATMVALCDELDGIPLAIELAAARTRSMTPGDLLSRLGDRFRLLRTTDRGRVARHQTLRATVEWSYQLISDDERLLFDRLSVFLGGFDLADAEAVCGDDALDTYDIAGLLSSLVEKSMVVADRDGHGIRYRLLETLRRYGQEQLDASASGASVRDAHVTHYITVARRLDEERIGPRQRDMDLLFERDWDNLRACVRWAVDTSNLVAGDALIASTGAYAWCRLLREHAEWGESLIALEHDGAHPSPTTYGWVSKWHPGPGETWARRGIELAPSPDHPDTAICWVGLTYTGDARGRHADSERWAQQAQRVARGTTDVTLHVEILTRLASVALSRGDVDAVNERVSALTAAAAQTNAPSLLAWAAYYEGRRQLWIQEPRDPAGALATFRRGQELARSVRDVLRESLNLAGVVYASIAHAASDTASVCLEALTRLHDTRSWLNIWVTTLAVAGWLAATGEPAVAAVVYGHVAAHRPPYSHVHATVDALDELRQQPGAAAAIARGAAMDREDVLEFVIDHLRSHT